MERANIFSTSTNEQDHLDGLQLGLFVVKYTWSFPATINQNISCEQVYCTSNQIDNEGDKSVFLSNLTDKDKS